jgi:hypothetical protein
MIAMCLPSFQKIVFDYVESLAGRAFNIQRSRPTAKFVLDIFAVLMKKIGSQTLRFCDP